MKEWFDSLSDRERYIVMGGGVLVVVILFWSLVLNPVYSGVNRLSQQVESKRVLVGWMQSAAAEIKAAGNVTGGGQLEDNQSLVVVIARSARESGLEKALNQNQPIGEDGIRVRLERASFDTIAGWLAKLQASNGLSLESANFERSTAPGMVNASIVLRQPG
ncbi:MAG: type II secretion system protein GspM [Gammaproteobacteria bacterium]